MCFSILVGKKASASGNVLLATNDDGAGCPGRVCHVPPRSWPEGAEYVTVDGTRIPQLPKTYGYTYSAAAYTTGTLDISWADGVNENRVAVAMTGAYAFADYHTERDHLEADDLSLLILQRSTSARHAIETVAELIRRYGFTTSSIEGARGSATLAIADPEEGFFLELLPGGHWCAKRVADNEAECRGNCFGIGEIDFADPVNFLCSPGLYELALKSGKLRPGETLNFSKVFGSDTSDISPSYGGALNPVNTSRKWNFLHAAGGLDIPLEEPRYSCKPSAPISVRGLMDIMRSDLAGTRYDPSVCWQAGVNHNPYWAVINPSISQSGTIVCMVADLARDKAKGKAWFSCCNAQLSPFVPCYTSGHGLPPAYQTGEYTKYDPESAWWVFEELNELCYRNYDAVARKTVIPAINVLEDRFFSRLQAAEENAGGEPWTDVTDSLAEEALDWARELTVTLKGKYLCNTVLSGSNPLATI